MTETLAPPLDPVEDLPTGPQPLTTSLGAGRTRVKLRWFATELVIIAAALAAVAFLVANLRDWGNTQLRTHLVLAGVGTVVWGVVLLRQRLYQARFISTRLQEWRRMINAGGLATLTMLAIGSLVTESELSRGWVLLSAVAVFGGLLVEREVVRHMFSRARRSGRMLRDVVIVGANVEGEELRTVIEASPELGYRFIGFVETPAESAREDMVVVGKLKDLETLVADAGIDNVIIAGSSVEPDEVKHATRALVSQGVHVELSPVLADTSIERVTLHQLGPHPLVYLEPSVQSGTSAVAKRVFDIVFSSMVLVGVAPIMLGTAILIKLESRGPVFFRQERLGHQGKLFPVLKFRSMYRDAEPGELNWKLRTNRRVRCSRWNVTLV